MDARFLKNPVHEIVDELNGVGKLTGYRCILSADGCIYELQADGTFISDSDIGLGASCPVIGIGGAGRDIARFLKAETISECLTPFFGDGNDKDVIKAAIWGDKIVVIRGTGEGSSDVILIKANGDSFKTESMAFDFNNIVVDSLLNIWVSHDGGLFKMSAGDTDSIRANFSVATGSIPFDKIKHIVVNGNELFIVQNETNDFKIAKYNGYQFEDLTAQFKSDTGVSVLTGASCTDMCMDDEGNLLIAMVIGANKLFVYDGVTFAIKTVAAGITSIKKIVKVGDVVYSIINDDTLKVWNYDTLEVLLSVYTALLGLLTDGVEVIAFKDNHIYKALSGGFAFAEDTVGAAALTVIDAGFGLLSMAAVASERVYLLDGDHPVVKGVYAERWVTT